VRFLLDTNVVIALMRLDPIVVKQANRHRAGELATSSLVLFELYFGAQKSSRVAANLKVLSDVDIPVLDFEEPDARVAAEIRYRLESQGRPIGGYDVLIAGQALARDLTLVTRNTSEFSRVEGLRIENWEA
jgi:tRNA(fMet)-specific endonuclease VapC